MRTCYVPRDVLKSTTIVSSKLNDPFRILNFTRSESDITVGTVSHTIDEDKSSFMDDLSDSGPLTYIPSPTIIDEEDEMLEVCVSKA